MSFFTRLNEAGVRYGIFKSSRNTLIALAGDQDLDILVAREDYRLFCATAAECGGIRSVNHASLVSPGREDWFIPDFKRVKFLHLDVHTGVRLGGKFNKRYPCYAYGDILHWDMVTFEDCLIPIVSSGDEAAITLSRVAFRANGKNAGPWQRLAGDWAREIDELLFAGAETGERAMRHQSAGLEVRCRVRKCNNEIWVHREDLASIRRLVQGRCGALFHSAMADRIANAIRTWRYTTSRVFGRVFPGSAIDRRRPASGGLIVAVVAPDGMGKTTQVDRMFRLFSWKFCCARLYLGSGDGHGWWLRRLVRTLYIRRRSKIRASLLNDIGSAREARTLASRVGSFLLASWGVLIALERYSRVRAARRMADRGFLVFCDRWPQSTQPGCMDGPTRRPQAGPTSLLRSWELSLYAHMSRVSPDVVAHLVGDYAISQARKPDELTSQEFEKRISLMAEIRAGAPCVRVIDAAGEVDEVSRSLFRLVWNAL